MLGLKEKKSFIVFKNIEEIKNANYERLCKVPGISKETAMEIFNFLIKNSICKIYQMY